MNNDHGRQTPVADVSTPLQPSAASTAWQRANSVAADAQTCPTDEAARRSGSSVAIVGMAARMPGAPNLEAFWSLLIDGRDAVTRMPEDRRVGASAYLNKLNPAQRAAMEWGGFIDAIADFDAPFFGISAAEARSLDPKQRLALEMAWHALEDAAIAPDSLRGSRTGVFIGTSVYDYYERVVEQPEQVDAYLGSGNFNCVVANRISYLLDLRGPSMAVETACSASLTALHLACASLRDGSCDLAMAGGVMTLLSPAVTASFALGGFLAPDGRCKTFDDSADGYVRGEGAGMVVLKSLDRALADGDRIWAVIEATVLNQDGRSNGLTAPNPKAQEALLREAFCKAGVAPQRIDYVEAHGTGTRLGDPIEVNALGAVCGINRDSAHPLRVGSVKSNIGHLEAAAGIAGVIKTALALHHGVLPATLHCRQPNQLIEFKKLNIQVQDARSAWPRGADGRRWAGVSSFSFAGANAHVVLASLCASAHAPAAARSCELLVLSAKTEAALQIQREQLATVFASRDLPLPEAAFSLQRGRAAFRQRAACVVSSGAEACQRLTDLDGVLLGEGKGRPPRVAWLFSGQGAQFPGMGRDLYAAWPAFRTHFDRCALLMQPWLDTDLRSLCFGGDADRLQQTQYAQPALFVIEFAIASALGDLGLKANAVIGHSVGEYAAAVVAGVMNLATAAQAICARGRAISTLPPGQGMRAVLCSQSSVRELIDGCGLNLHICAVNAADAVTIGGGLDQLEAFAKLLDARGVASRALDVSHAFHTPAMAPAQSLFADCAQSLLLSPPEMPFYSSMLGRNASQEIITSDYWIRQIGQPVLFGEAVTRLLRSAKFDVIVEIGPGSSLLSLAKRNVPDSSAEWLATMPRDGDGWRQMLQTLGRWFVAGAAPDWHALYAMPAPRPVSLPGYAFQRTRHWLGDGVANTAAASVAARSQTIESFPHGLLGAALDLSVPTRIHSTRIGIHALPALCGHRVFGAVVLPGSAALSLAMQALQATPLARACITDLHWPSALYLDGAETSDVQTVVEDSAIRVLCRKNVGSPEWIEILSARRSTADSCVAQMVGGDPGVSSDFSGLNSAPARALSTLLYQRLKNSGLEYADAFRAVVAAAHDDNSVLALVERAQDLNPLLYGTVMLDAALHACGLFTDAGALVPWALERFEWTGCTSSQWRVHWHRRNGVRSGSDEIIADGVAWDSNGEVAARWTGLRLRAAKHLRLQGASGIRAEPLPQATLYSCEWHGSRLFGGALPAGLPLTVAAETETADVARYRDQLEKLERAALALLPAVVEVFGVALAADRSFTDADVDACCARLAPERQRLLRRCLLLAGSQQQLSAQGGRYILGACPSLRDASQSLGSIAGPEAAAEAQLLMRCLDALPDLLAGRRNAVEVLFQGDGARLLADVYGRSAGSRACNQLVSQTLADLQVALPMARGLRVLEVGAGTGATSAEALAVLDMARCQYTFSDVSSSFLSLARERFATMSGLSWRTFDLESERSLATFGESRFDVIVAANVVHATRDIAASLRRLRSLLAPGGRLLLLEVVKPQLWLDLTFGLTEGWWAYQDQRQDSPLLNADQWNQALLGAGFEAVASSGAQWGLHQHLLVARAPAPLEVQAPWWILGHDSAQLRRYGTCLEKDGHLIHIVDLTKTSLRAVAAAAAPRGVIWCAAGGMDATTQCTRLLEVAQDIVASAWVQAPQLFVLTRGGQSVLPHEAVVDLAAAATLGLLRSIDLEHPELQVTAIDLDPSIDTGPNHESEALSAELRTQSGEREIAWRSGQRFVHRLCHLSLPSTNYPRILNKGNGALDQLTFASVPVVTPGPGKVRITVWWSGLNFLDLLDALGTLPFERPGGLGSECVGQIESVGPGVHNLQVGDWVMAIAEGAMASTVLADQHCAVRVPDRLPLAQAVGVPVAFLTAQRALRAAEVVAGDRVLVHAAAGATGAALLSLARARGAHVYATASASKQAWVRERGAEAVFDSRTIGFADALLATTQGRGVSVVINSLTSPGFIKASLSCLAQRGRFVELAKQEIWSTQAMQAARADVSYHIVDVYREIAERPEDTQSDLLNICTGIESGQITPLPVRAQAAERAESVFRQMQRGQHIGKLALSWRVGITARHLRCDGGGSYLITGGFGGLGLVVAQWLVDLGARHLVLIGRHGAHTESAREVIDRLRQRGAVIEAQSLDVTDSPALRQLCQRFGNDDLPELRGVFHAAGVLSDAVLTQQSRKSLAAVIAPKLDAAMVLADAVCRQPLSIFAMFSSVAGLFGSAGQGNHAAANAGLDGLAAQLQARGVPAVSIDWGAVSQIGAAAALGADARVASKGMDALTPGQAITALEMAIGSGLAQIAAVPMRWTAADPTLRARPMLSALCSEKERVEAKAEGELDSAVNWRTLALVDRKPALERLVQNELAKVLGFSSRALDLYQGFTDLGVDSLGAVEMRNRLQRELSVPLPSSTIFDHPNVAALADYLCTRLAGSEAVSKPAAAPAVAALESDDIIKRLSDKLARLGKGVSA